MGELSILILVVLAVLLTIIVWNKKAEPYMKSIDQGYVSTNPSNRYVLESNFNQPYYPSRRQKLKFKLHPN